jgi:indole-3-glycerol phosphate synthase
MSILEKIVASKYKEVEERKLKFPVSTLEKSKYFNRITHSLKTSILREGSFGIISEYKRKSPSKGIINASAQPVQVCSGYHEAGSSALSVLTDYDYFGGTSHDLSDVRQNVNCPILRKDFIIDEYQITEARSIGADAVLLIAEVHDAKRLGQLFRFARSLELEVLVELHDEKNIARIPPDAEIIGINSRDLASFNVNFDHLTRMVHLLPGESVKVAESGIKSVNDYLSLKNAGFNAFLIGEQFMKSIDPAAECKSFISMLGESLTNDNRD